MTPSMPKMRFAEVAARLDRAGLVWAVFAGAAAAVYGADRPVTDVDILVPAADGERVATLVPDGTVWRDEDGRILGIKLPGTSVPCKGMPGIDILAGLSQHTSSLSYDIDLDSEMLPRRTYHEIAGVTAPVIPPEDNILLKAIWRRGSSQGKHDWEDVQAMLARLPAVDWDYLRWRIDTCCSGPGRWQVLQDLVNEASSQRGEMRRD